MSDDLTETLHTAVDGPVAALDHDTLRRRAARRTTTTRVATAGGGVVITAAIIGAVIAVQTGAPPSLEIVASEGNPGGTIVVSEAQVAAAFANCEVLTVEVLDSRQHFEPPSAPNPEEIYTAGRPTASGPHYAWPASLLDSGSDQQLDERATTHNLEHGAIVVWYDPAQLDDDTIADINQTVDTLNAAGFANEPARAGIFTSPYTDPGIDSGNAIALRAWGQAQDCASWNPNALLGFTAAHYGAHGSAPEGNLAPYPEAALTITGGT